MVAKKRLLEISTVCSKESLTPAGKERKMRIMEKLLYTKKTKKKQKKNRFTFKSLPQRATYFQIVCLNISTKEPSVHQLFDELKDVCLNIFLLFHQIGKCQKLIIKKLAKLDVKDHNHQLPVCDWFVEVCWSFFVFLFLASYSMILSQTLEFLISYCHWKYCESVCASISHVNLNVINLSINALFNYLHEM